MSSQPSAPIVLAVWLAALASACDGARAPISAPAAETPAPKASEVAEEEDEGLKNFHLRLQPYLTKTSPEIAKLQRDRKFCSQLGELCSIRLENAVADAEGALRAGDARILGIWDYSIWFPGLSRDEQDRVFSLDVPYRGIRGTSDAVMGQTHADLIDYAADYAAIYNQFVVKNRPKDR